MTNHVVLARKVLNEVSQCDWSDTPDYKCQKLQRNVANHVCSKNSQAIRIEITTHDQFIDNVLARQTYQNEVGVCQPSCPTTNLRREWSETQHTKNLDVSYLYFII